MSHAAQTMGWRAHYGVPLMDQEHNLIAQTGVCVGRGIVAALHLGASGRIEGRDERCRDLYNAALYQGREAYRALGQRVGYYAQKRALPALRVADAGYCRVGSPVLQDVIRRVEVACAAFFRHVQAGEKPGFPWCRGRDRYESVTYSRQVCWKIADGRLALSSVGAIKADGAGRSARAIFARAGLADPLRGYPVASAPAAESHPL